MMSCILAGLFSVYWQHVPAVYFNDPSVLKDKI